VNDVVQYLGHFQHKEDADEAYEHAAKAGEAGCITLM